MCIHLSQCPPPPFLLGIKSKLFCFFEVQYMLCISSLSPGIAVLP